jgi:hypothetical protein
MPPFLAVYVLGVVAVALASGHWQPAVYALSFWHYLVYALAFLWRQIPHGAFMRDAMLLKAVALAAFVPALWQTMPNAAAWIVMAIGFAINILATRALGAERTYYGLELEALQPMRLTSFPYSVMAHPMLIGNMVAFAGPLLDQAFRTLWWPLAVLHVLLNLLILLIEIYGCQSLKAGVLVALTGLLAGSILLLAWFIDAWPFTLAMVVLSLVFGAFVMRRYRGFTLASRIGRSSDEQSGS